VTASANGATGGAAVEIETTHGAIRGRRNAATGVCSFLGVPYAQPPIGMLRWRHPAPAEAWSEPLDGTRFGAAGPQPVGLGGSVEQLCDEPAAAVSAGWLGDEDCLTLNVWTRLTGGGPRPVMVWIHGGANWLESSRAEIYAGEELANHHDLVVVSLNYRLGIFGFLDVSVLGDASYAGAHSLGLRDQQLAIEWITNNAEAFGGDPGNITLAGQSAGSMDISWHLTTGRLPAGVRRVALMSGVAGVPGVAEDEDGSHYSETDGKRVASELLSEMGVSSMADLLDASTDDLLTRFCGVVASRDMLFDLDSIFFPRVDGSHTPTTPFAHVVGGGAGDVAIMLGTTDHEANIWIGSSEALDGAAEDLARRLERVSPELAEDMAFQYDNWFGPDDHAGPGLHLLSDAMFVMPTHLFADAHASGGGQTWLYRFSRELPDARLGAAHASDLAYFLGTWHCGSAQRFLGPADDREALARDQIGTLMMGCLANFVRSGSPTPDPDGGADWPQYRAPARYTMRFADNPRLESDPLRERRQWWMSHVYRWTEGRT
jgi:para-nitrobenzyl esterase